MYIFISSLWCPGKTLGSLCLSWFDFFYEYIVPIALQLSWGVQSNAWDLRSKCKVKWVLATSSLPLYFYCSSFSLQFQFRFQKDNVILKKITLGSLWYPAVWGIQRENEKKNSIWNIISVSYNSTTRLSRVSEFNQKFSYKATICWDAISLRA